MTAPSRFLRSERGAELVEFALSLPVLCLVVFGIADFGLLFQRNLVITNAAREGARMAVLPGYTTADVEARVNSYLSAAGVPGSATTLVTEETATAPSGATIPLKHVTVTYTYPMGIVSGAARLVGASFGPLTLRGVASMRLEVASGGG